jgi:hypothetical protein
VSLTGDDLLKGLSVLINDWWESSATATQGDATALTDAALAYFGEETLVDGFIRVTQGDTNQNDVRRITSFVDPEAGVSPDFDEIIADNDTYEFHRYDPAKKFRALDIARVMAFPQLGIIRFDETMTGDGMNDELLIPPSMRKGPVEVWEETLLGPVGGWNALSDPQLTSLASTWTASGATASLYARNDMDVVVPRNEQNCVKLVGSGTYTQTVANMRSGMTAALVAGRRVSFAAWVYQRGSTGTATISITHDSATVASTTHQGRGWERLEVSATIPSGNATTFNALITTGGAVTIFAEWAYLVLGDRVPASFDTRLSKRGVWRDDASTEVRLIRPPSRGHQLRLIGRDPLSALGDVAATQGSNTMEVDEFSARLLYAKAARVLLVMEGWSTGDIAAQFPFIQELESEFAELEPDWSYSYPHEMRLEGWWSLG